MMAIIFSTEHRFRSVNGGGGEDVSSAARRGDSAAVMEQQSHSKRGWWVAERRRRQLSLAQQLVYGLLVILISLTGSSTGLRDVHIIAPVAVKKGDNANLICNYDMEGDTLYTVKWYKGRREFYRYTPKENPAIKVFPHSGIQIEENMSNGSNIVLLSLDTPLSGKYSCEVSADAPLFHTTIVSAEMEVVEAPEERPSITGILSRYRIGDIIKGNCSSEHSRPAANLTWTINDIPVPRMNTLDYKVTKNASDNSETSTIGLYYLVSHTTFARGKIKAVRVFPFYFSFSASRLGPLPIESQVYCLPCAYIHLSLQLRCYAQIFNVYKSFSDKIIEEVIPRILATGHNGAANLLQNAPYDESSNGMLPDHQMDENGMLIQRDHDSYLHQQYNDLTSTSSSAGLRPSRAFINWMPRSWISGGGAALFLSLVSFTGSMQLLSLGHFHRKRHIILQYLIIVAPLIISAIVTRIRC